MWRQATDEDFKASGTAIRLGRLSGTVRERRHARTTDGKGFSTWEVDCGGLSIHPGVFLATGMAEAECPHVADGAARPDEPNYDGLARIDMSITEAVAHWIEAKADRARHRHEWELVCEAKVSDYAGVRGFRFVYTCKTCEKSKVVKTY